MKRAKILLSVFAISLFTSCTTTIPLTKKEVYKGLYDNEMVSVIIMPPINRSTNVEAKEYFHSTLNMPMADAGYYVNDHNCGNDVQEQVTISHDFFP